MPGALGWIKIPKNFADFFGFFRKDELMNGEVFPEGCPEGLKKDIFFKASEA